VNTNAQVAKAYKHGGPPLPPRHSQ